MRCATIVVLLRVRRRASMPKENCFIDIDYFGGMMFAVPRIDQGHIAYCMSLEQI
jgi:hypothetical protein